MKLSDIGYIAGIYEGEGSFSIYRRSSFIHIATTDKDVIEKIKEILKISHCTQEEKPKIGKKIYKLRLHGKLGISLMMTIYPMMSIRRKEQIKKCINNWMTCERGHDLRLHGRTRFNRCRKCISEKQRSVENASSS